MQWAKVKNVLIIILAAVNIFLLCNLGMKFWQARERERELAAHLDMLAAGYGITLDEDLQLPKDVVLPTLSLDRSRTSEEAVAAAMLGIDMERTEQEDGGVLFESEEGSLQWQADGTVQGTYRMGKAASQNNKKQLIRLARELLETWGVVAEDATYTVDGARVTVSGSAAGMSVFNRTLTLEFEPSGQVKLSGLWSFGMPYTTAREDGVSCIASDALLEFASKDLPCKRIESMSVGYRLLSDSSKRLQLTPTWKIETDSGDYLVDCAKNTILT